MSVLFYYCFILSSEEVKSCSDLGMIGYHFLYFLRCCNKWMFWVPFLSILFELHRGDVWCAFTLQCTVNCCVRGGWEWGVAACSRRCLFQRPSACIGFFFFFFGFVGCVSFPLLPRDSVSSIFQDSTLDYGDKQVDKTGQMQRIINTVIYNDSGHMTSFK